MLIHIKRVYEEAEKSDGVRILVDRLWPRPWPLLANSSSLESSQDLSAG